MRPFPIDISGGVNLLKDPRRVGANEVVYAQNLVPSDPGVYRTRPAIAFAGQALTPSSGGTLATVMDALLQPILPARGDLVATAIFPVGVSSNDTILFSGNSELSITQATLGVRNLRPWMVTLAGKVFVLGGPGASATARTVEFSVDPSTHDLLQANFAFAGTGNGAVRPRLVAGYRSRYVWANFGTGYENTLVFSDNFVPGTVGNDVLASNGRNVSLVSTYDGDEIVGVVEVMTSNVGSPAQAALLVLRRRSAFLLTGEPDQTTGGTNSLVVNRLAVDAGCASPWTIVKTPYGTIWASEDDVWLMDVGSVPRPIGIKIRKALRQSPPGLLYRWTAAYFDGFYRLAVYSEGQGPTELDPLGEQWWLDLRDGAPRSHADARWWGPMKFFNAVKDADAIQGTRTFMLEGRPGREAALYGLEVGMGQTAGAAAYNFVRYGVSSPRDSNVDNSDLSTAVISDEIGDEIQIDLITREFDFNEYDGISASREKIHDGLEMAVWNSNPGRLIVNAIINGGESTSTTNLDLYNAGFEAGVDQLDAGTSSAARVPQAVAAHPFPRPVGITYQFRIRNQPGYLVTDENDTLTFRRVDTQVEYRATIAQGLYLFIDGSASFANALKSALDAATGLTWTVTYDHTSGIFVFELPAGPISVEIPLVGDLISPNFATDAEMLENRRILAMLGMATQTDITPTLSITGESPIYQKANSIWEFSSLDALMEVLPRRP